MVAFSKSQNLNEWVEMLDAIYGGSQNYAKTPYEIHAHLTEVCGVFAKHFFKKKDIFEAKKFVPKIFAWTVALLRKVRSDGSNLEEIILRKFPNACPYCLKKPCSCWSGDKPTLDENSLRDAYYQNSRNVKRSINDFQLMFQQIYQDSWRSGMAQGASQEDLFRRLFIRLIEEVAEVGESLRFHHLYPENFDNELSDLMAWWFAIVSLLPSEQPMLAEDYLWTAYPGRCPHCQMVPCLCRPGPVRQLMSRPIPGHQHRFDGLTSFLNQAAYNEDLQQIKNKKLIIPYPSACIRLDVDDFKSVNSNYGHPAGDEALKHISSIIRRTARERDWLYRISGDEFGILCPDYTEEEASGAMRRVCAALALEPVKWVGKNGEHVNFKVSVSIGVAELTAPESIEDTYSDADDASYFVKNNGKGNIARSSQVKNAK